MDFKCASDCHPKSAHRFTECTTTRMREIDAFKTTFLFLRRCETCCSQTFFRNENHRSWFHITDMSCTNVWKHACLGRNAVSPVDFSDRERTVPTFVTDCNQTIWQKNAKDETAL